MSGLFECRSDSLEFLHLNKDVTTMAKYPRTSNVLHLRISVLINAASDQGLHYMLIECSIKI